MFTEWFELNKREPEARGLTYAQIPQKYVWHEKERIWKLRKQKKSIGRMVYSNPASGDRYYLRLTLTIAKGPESFQHLMTVNKITYQTFKEVCFAYGLLNDDKELTNAISEARFWALAPQLRDLFVTILLFCEIEELLHRFGRSLAEFAELPRPNPKLLTNMDNRLIREALDFDMKTSKEGMFVLEKEVGLGKMSSRSSRTLYVGNLPGDIREREVEDLFYKYGPIVHIDLKVPPRPPGFAFVEFEEARDADDAIRGRDGYDFDGHRLRVELAHGGRVLVTGLPSSASWQDLKDHMRKAGDVCFTQVFREGTETTGIADYTNYDDMKYAIRKLDDTEFRNAFSRAYIRDHMRKAGDVCFTQVFREGTETTGIADYTNYDDMKYAIRKLDDTEFRNAFSRAYIRALGSEFLKRNVWILNSVVSETFADPLQDPDLLYRLKSPKAKSSRRSRSLSKSASPRSGTKRRSLSRSHLTIYDLSLGLYDVLQTGFVRFLLKGGRFEFRKESAMKCLVRMLWLIMQLFRLLVSTGSLKTRKICLTVYEKEFSYMEFYDGHCKAGQLSLAEELFSRIGDMKNSNGFVGFLLKGGRFEFRKESAMKCLIRMLWLIMQLFRFLVTFTELDSSLIPIPSKIVSWNAMIDGHCKAGQLSLAEELFSRIGD
ncbi:hypothetical protein CTI12_AA314830 [Artemisia annua]|uniref:RRM domain-containing protein n=1 Tax=Artemisia annua TaxID=35608 RepID=A0A2U1N1M0_ARTAN|nr:hypothetical protein CTI12_AA314830 [Artemisia annua]